MRYIQDEKIGFKHIKTIVKKSRIKECLRENGLLTLLELPKLQ